MTFEQWWENSKGDLNINYGHEVIAKFVWDARQREIDELELAYSINKGTIEIQQNTINKLKKRIKENEDSLDGMGSL